MARRDRLPGWDEMTPGGQLMEAGSAASYVTGTWRTQYPEFIEANCTHCLLCWMYCPDNSIIVEDGRVTGIDYVHCKGCGLCAEVCPTKPKAIEMHAGTEPEAVPEQTGEEVPA